jgi:hypothetical protein
MDKISTHLCRILEIREQSRPAVRRVRLSGVFPDAVKVLACGDHRVERREEAGLLLMAVGDLDERYKDEPVGTMTIPIGFVEEVGMEAGERYAAICSFDDQVSRRSMTLVRAMPPHEAEVLYHFCQRVPPVDFSTADFMASPACRDFYEDLHGRIINAISRLPITRDWRVAEPGCSCFLDLSIRVARRFGVKVWASDASRDVFLRIFTENMRNPLFSSGQISMGCYPVAELDQYAPEEKFDLVLLSGLFNLQVMGREEDVLNGLAAVWRATRPGGYVFLTGKTAALVRARELRRMGFNVLATSLPELLFYERARYAEQFYILQRGEGAFCRPPNLEMFTEMV